MDESTRSQAPTRSAPTPRPPSHPGSPALQAPVERRGTVKWYNAAKGFGFVAISDSGKDVFVHASALQRSGVPQLTEGQTVWVGVVQGTKGPEAVSVKNRLSHPLGHCAPRRKPVAEGEADSRS